MEKQKKNRVLSALGRLEGGPRFFLGGRQKQKLEFGRHSYKNTSRYIRTVLFGLHIKKNKNDTYIHTFTDRLVIFTANFCGSFSFFVLYIYTKYRLFGSFFGSVIFECRFVFWRLLDLSCSCLPPPPSVTLPGR